ncbi:MAG: HEPN domain-containing protein [Armatimonadota bacterium]
MKNDIPTLIQYRLTRSRESLAAAELLIENRFYQETINRLYYACFYAATALLLQLGLSPKTHAGVRSLFNERVIRDGLLPLEYGDFYTKLFDVRHETDYADLVETNPETIRKWLPLVKRFIDAVEQLVAEREQG